MAAENKTGGDDDAAKPASRFDDVRLAVAFLTRLPMGDFRHPGSLADAAWAFPLVGVIVGGIGSAIYYGANVIDLPPMIGAFLTVAAMVLATGALHEDGLADVADGFGGGAVISRKLEIMRDSRIGSYGVLALVISVGLRVATISSIGRGEIAIAVILAAAIASRAVLPSLMAALPMAREDGLAHGAGQPTQTCAGISLALGGLGLLVLLQPSLMLMLFAGGAAALGAIVVGIIARRQIGGQTGDVIGAAQQVAEMAVLIAAVAVLA